MLKIEPLWSCRQTLMYGLCAVTSYKISSELFGQTHSTMMKHLLVSQARPTSAREGRGSGEQRIQAVSRRTVQCGTIRLQYFVT